MDRSDLGFVIAIIEAPVLAAVDHFLPPGARLAGYVLCALAALAMYFQAALRSRVSSIAAAVTERRPGVLLAITAVQLVVFVTAQSMTWWYSTPVDNVLVVALGISSAWQVVKLWIVRRHRRRSSPAHRAA